MFTDLKNVSILIAQLKKYSISNVVISAGTRHIPFVFSIEKDDYFKTYLIVDERSASFFALGLIEKTHKPVAVICTSGTAACNYLSAVNEAFYQRLPLVVLTADRNNYYTNQQEEQMVMQPDLYGNATLKSVTLPIVRDDKDAWYCGRIINEALLELNHRDPGPVHINIPVEDNYPLEWGILSFDSNDYVETTQIKRIMFEDSYQRWQELAEELIGKKVLIIYGQNFPASLEEIEQINRFACYYNCMISIDLLSNIECDKSLYTYSIMPTLTEEQFTNLIPDIVITMNGHTLSSIKPKLKNYKDKFEHWHISSLGEISDSFKVQSKIIECKNINFFKLMSDIAENIKISPTESYYRSWCNTMDEAMCLTDAYKCKLQFSTPLAIQKLMERIPNGSNLHLANSNTVRIANNFRLDNSIEVTCNRGTHGIDGSMSSFIGQSAVCNSLSFLIIGDLSFFYDMNGLWNRYVGSNVRILLCNNSGGGIFHSPYYQKGSEFKNIDEHIAAGHSSNAKGWAESVYMDYSSASNSDELIAALDTFFDDNGKPKIIEVFTNMDVDIKEMQSIVFQMRTQNKRNKISSMLPDSTKKTLKKLIGKR